MMQALAAKLERVQATLATLGDPQRGCPVIHVGGTNGKGSVCAMLASILCSAGLRVGRFTSPHLEDWTERIWQEGRPIAPSTLSALLDEVRKAELAALGEPGLGEFARLTVAAFLHFARTRPDVVVLEVGRGGRFDATNVVPEPLLSIVTNVTEDHADVLGPTEADIAWHKAGIARPGRILLTGARGPALAALERAASSLGARVQAVEPASYAGPRAGGQRIAWGGRVWDLGLEGTYQLSNAALALAAIPDLRERGLALADSAVEQGLASVSWPGRMELWSSGGERWLFDGAHNPAGAAELAASLARDCKDEPLVLVFGSMVDKPAARMLQVLAPRARVLILTAPPAASALDPRLLAAGIAHPDKRVVAEPRAALEVARRAAGGSLVVVCGSLYLVGLARRVAQAPAP